MTKAESTKAKGSTNCDAPNGSTQLTYRVVGTRRKKVGRASSLPRADWCFRSIRRPDTPTPFCSMPGRLGQARCTALPCRRFATAGRAASFWPRPRFALGTSFGPWPSRFGLPNQWQSHPPKPDMTPAISMAACAASMPLLNLGSRQRTLASASLFTKSTSWMTGMW